MAGDSLYNLDASSVTLGAVLARGSPGVTLYEASLCIGSQSLKAAVKRLQTCGAPADAESAFVKEMQTLQLASSACQRACRLLGCCKIDGDACIVMSLYPKTAAKRLEEAKGALPLDEVVAIGLEVLEGLEQLHEAHILHLDLKPANILLDKHGHAYLSDFGISHAIRTLETCTAITGMSGTPHYMAPEQVDAEFGVRGHHSDVWSFAATLLHLATGQLPYAGLTQMQMVSAMFKRRPPDVPASLPTWLQQALKECLSFEVAARPTIISLHQLFKTQAKQGSCGSGAPPPVPAAAHSTKPSSQAAVSQPMSKPENSILSPRTSSNGGQPAGSMKKPAMQSGMSEIVATVQAARAQLGTINHKVVNEELLSAIRDNSFQNAKQALLQGADMRDMLRQAAQHEDLRILELLLALGGDVDERDIWGLFPLMYVRSLGALHLLLSYGANPAATTFDGWNALMSVAEEICCDPPQVIELLLSLGLDINAATSDGRTALMCAARTNRHRDVDVAIKVIDILILHGADLHARDSEGKSAEDLAWKVFHSTNHINDKTVAMHLQHLVGAKRP